LLAVGLAVGAVLTKYPTAALIPVIGALWALRSARTWGGAARRLALVVGVSAVMALPLLEGTIDVLGDRGGTGRVASNLWRLLSGAAPMLGLAVAGAGLLLLVQLVPAAPERRRGRIAAWIKETVTARSRRAPFALLLLLTALASTLPFVLNERYFKDYYATFVAVWFGVFAARALVRAWPADTQRWHWALALAFALTGVPRGAIQEAFDPSPRNRVGEWLEEANAALASAPPAASIGIQVRCPEGGDARQSDRRLLAYHRLSEQGHGLRWAARLDPGVEITVAARGDVTLYYCESETPRFVLASSTD